LQQQEAQQRWLEQGQAWPQNERREMTQQAAYQRQWQLREEATEQPRRQARGKKTRQQQELH
jgi:hypothetical protein